jgi:hypothetical protein
MKSQSADLPITVRIKNILSGIATIRLIKNIEPYKHEDISGYRYDSEGERGACVKTITDKTTIRSV